MNKYTADGTRLASTYYTPTEEGVEGRFKTRLEEIKRWKRDHSDKK